MLSPEASFLVTADCGLPSSSPGSTFTARPQARNLRRHATLKIFHKSQRVVNSGMDVSACNRVADPQQSEQSFGIADQHLRASGEKGLVVDLASVHGSLLQLFVQIIERQRSMFHHDLIGGLLDYPLSELVMEGPHQAVAVSTHGDELQVNGDFHIVLGKSLK